jgi:hypothetical protein
MRSDLIVSTLSLTPGFSPVSFARDGKPFQRFFQAGLETVETVSSLAFFHTGLKPGVNESRAQVSHRRLRHIVRGQAEETDDRRDPAS